MWGETTRVGNRGETTRGGGERPGGKRLGGEASCYPFDDVLLLYVNKCILLVLTLNLSTKLIFHFQETSDTSVQFLTLNICLSFQGNRTKFHTSIDNTKFPLFRPMTFSDQNNLGWVQYRPINRAQLGHACFYCQGALFPWASL